MWVPTVGLQGGSSTLMAESPGVSDHKECRAHPWLGSGDGPGCSLLPAPALGTEHPVKGDFMLTLCHQHWRNCRC